MKTIYLVALAICALTALASAEDVVVLTDATFDDFIKNEALTLVEFYAPWCGHCKKLDPEYEKAAGMLKTNDPPVKIAKVDATVEKTTAGKFKIEGFPTIKLFKNGEFVADFQGERSAEGIASYMKKRAGPAVSEADADKINKMKEENDVVVVFFGAKDSSEFSEFEKAAGKEESITFVANFSDDDAKEFDVDTNDNVIVVFKKFDEGRMELTDDITADSISSFVDSNRLALVTPFNDGSAQKIFGGAIKVHTLLLADSTASGYSDVLAAFTAAAKGFRGKTIFVSVDKDQEGVVNFFGVSKDDMPAVRVVDLNAGMKKYSYPAGPVTAAGVTAFVNDYFSGNLRPALKSQEAPESNDGPVRVVVGKTFEEEVFNDDKDVLIEYYAPWCGHCKSLAPIWDQLGEKMKGNEHIVIAKMDAEANESEHVEVKGFPTIHFFKAGSKKGLEYSGDRTLEGFLKYLKDNSSKPLKDEL